MNYTRNIEVVVPSYDLLPLLVVGVAGACGFERISDALGHREQVAGRTQLIEYGEVALLVIQRSNGFAGAVFFFCQSAKSRAWAFTNLCRIAAEAERRIGYQFAVD